MAVKTRMERARMAKTRAAKVRAAKVRVAKKHESVQFKVTTFNSFHLNYRSKPQFQILFASLIKFSIAVVPDVCQTTKKFNEILRKAETTTSIRVSRAKRGK